ncbi:unnamed protein product, partial [Candidula unifasciata]
SRPVKIIFGFACDSQRPEESDYGMMLYHRNRLIKAFEKVGYQRQPNDLGVGVVGVAQVDFLQPIHNKQDFNKDEKFNSVMSAFANKLNDYWNEKKGSNSSAQPSVRNQPDWLWAQCEHCLKWRRLLDEVDPRSLPEQWFCRMNKDATHNRCDVPEEPEDEDLAVKPTYEKTFKKKQEERKKLQQLEREKEENMKRRKIMEKEQELQEKEAALRAIQQVAAAQPIELDQLQENRTVASLQKALMEARRREEQQKRLILQIQEQKKAILEQRNSLLQMAETWQSEEMNGDEVFQQMSQLINTLGPQFTPSTPALRRSPPPATNPRKQNKATKQNTPSVKAETERKSSKHHQNSPAVTNNSRSPGSTSSKHLTPAASPAKTSTEARAASTSGPPAASKRKRQRKGPVGDVIDLTDESEFSEVMDVKPNMPGDAAMALDGVQTQVAEVKPEKQSLDEVLSEKNNHTEITPKEEFFETVTQNSTSSSPTKKSDPATSDARASDATQGIQFRPDLAGNPEFLQDNLEAALAAIQDRMEKENLRQESELDDKDGVIKDEIRGENVTNNTDVAEGEKEVESGQSETVPAVSEAPKLDVDGETLIWQQLSQFSSTVDSPPIKMFHHKDIQSKKELMNDQYSDKSSQVTDLTTNSEAQTDLTLSTNSQKKTDAVKSLHKDISVKTELLEKMEARLAETYVNIHKLLGFIVPSAELGDISNIHQVVTDMVKYSEASPQPIIKGSSKV